MKKIEFRAWLLKVIPSRMVIVDKIDFDKKEIECIQGVYLWTAHSFDDIILMQYTGLKDKNRKKIFEGDMIKLPEDQFGGEEILIVIEANGFYTFKEHGLYLWDYNEKIEIIGNKFENPELLK